MYALNLDPELLWTFFSFDFNIDIAIETDWLVILRDLEVLWHIWVEVVLTSKAAIRRNAAIKGETDLDC
jgi:hypothetical protein